MSLLSKIRNRKQSEFDGECKVPGCTNPAYSCGPKRVHYPCQLCGGPTGTRRGYVNPKTLQRQVGFVHDDCARSARQRHLRSERTHDDWLKVTDPIATGALRPGEMPEQIPGPTRRALRAFQVSTAEAAVVEDAVATSLNASIAALGLTSEMYAETRGQQTVLRKVRVS